MVRSIFAVAILALGVSAVVAQDPIAARKAVMKDNNAQFRVLREMVDGKRPFDLAAAKKVFAGFTANAEKLKGLFPESSMKGETRALPVIWQKKSEFEAAIAKFGNDAKAAEAATKDVQSLKAQLGAVGKNCGDCHNAWRSKS
jgi:cytochrome c556